jgi:hypothetical protein
MARKYLALFPFEARYFSWCEIDKDDKQSTQNLRKKRRWNPSPHNDWWRQRRKWRLRICYSELKSVPISDSNSFFCFRDINCIQHEIQHSSTVTQVAISFQPDIFCRQVASRIYLSRGTWRSDGVHMKGFNQNTRGPRPNRSTNLGRKHCTQSGVRYREQIESKRCKIWGSHDGDYEEWRLLGCYAVWFL